MGDGWIKLHRRMVDSWPWQLPAGQLKVWLTILFLASWDDGEIAVDGKGVRLERGQLFTSLRRLAEASGESVQTVRATLANTRSNKAINKVANTRGMLITVTNYDRYQLRDEEPTKQPTHDPTHDPTHRSGPIKEYKEERRTYVKKSKIDPGIADRVLGKLRQHTGVAYRGARHAELIRARIQEGATEEDLRVVVWHRARLWACPQPGEKDMRPYLRPSTLFGRTKFADYLPQARAAYDAERRRVATAKRNGVSVMEVLRAATE